MFYFSLLSYKHNSQKKSLHMMSIPIKYQRLNSNLITINQNIQKFKKSSCILNWTLTRTKQNMQFKLNVDKNQTNMHFKLNVDKNQTKPFGKYLICIWLVPNISKLHHRLLNLHYWEIKKLRFLDSGCQCRILIASQTSFHILNYLLYVRAHSFQSLWFSTLMVLLYDTQ